MNLPLCTYLLLWPVTGYFLEQCREGATYSDAVVSPSFETQIMPMPHAVTMSDCITACCNLSGCDLSWMLEGHCYLVTCQHKENCEPIKMESVKSYLTFVLRPPHRVVPLPVYAPIITNMGHATGMQNDPVEDVSNIIDLSSLSKEHNLKEVPEYTDEYTDPDQDFIHLNTGYVQKGTPDYTSWTLSGSDNSFSSLVADTVDLSEIQRQETKLDSPIIKNGSNLNVEHHEKNKSPLTQDLLIPVVKLKRGETMQQLVKTRESFEKEIPTSSHSPLSGNPEVMEPVAEMTKMPSTVQWIPEQIAFTPLSTNAVTAPTTTTMLPPSPTSDTKTPDTVKHLVVSAGNNTQITLPNNEVELNAFVIPTPPAAVRGNQPPVAVASPASQDISLPTISTFIDGSQSRDDDKIISYHWEEIKGPLREQKVSADFPVLHLSNLVPGNYTFRLTVIDSDGAADSTIASLTVVKPVDYPPIANAGPNQALALSQNYVTLNGNQSSDDHQIVSYEWSLSPNSKSTVVEMQGVRTPYLQLSALQEGDYTFQLLITDSAGQQSTAQVIVIVQPENNSPPIAVTGPSKELTFPVDSTTLDGSKSTDDQGIVSYHWEKISGPGDVKIDNCDTAVATVSGLQIGTYQFQLTVKDHQGLSGASTLSVTVKEENITPPKSHAGGSHIITLPNNSITLDGSQSTNDRGMATYLWIRDGQSPAAGDVMYNSDHDAVLQLTNLVEGIYIFHLTVTNARGESDIDTATVEVRPDPRKSNLVELILQVGVGQLTEQQKDTLVRQLAVLLNVLDSDIKVQKIRAHSDLSTSIVFYVQNGHPFKVIKASDVSKALQSQLLKEKANFLFYKVLRVDTAVCLLKCSGHGHCDPITKRCICYPFWMENQIQRYLKDGESNCDWSVLYVTVAAFVLLVLTVGVGWLCIYCCKRKRIKIRKKTKYTILDNIDDQERMELRPKYGIKHRSTEHNSSLMISESEFESDQDTIFSREKTESENPKNAINGSITNGSAFNYS
ncbi:dyslexia-associated protein KIAA0319 homolog [Rhinatrema bivittatum]|uniref:dyslexia-associated protein KIAA0319 homolog n=1 Tax=Rhinatrema bivittatum TaxID=194408 RepID=UPI001129E2C0|nr:dyslexia-associated protein KIAA0319 homolog [Rhinatrema bivittatum]